MRFRAIRNAKRRSGAKTQNLLNASSWWFESLHVHHGRPDLLARKARRFLRIPRWHYSFKLIRARKALERQCCAPSLRSARKIAHERYGIPEDRCYESGDAFLDEGKVCDAIFICVQDAEHYALTMRALKIGYDICLEKPAAVNVRQCEGIRDEADRLGRKVMLTHVLRYTPFYQCVRQKIEDGSLGEVVHIDQTENIAYWHFGLSYVRGPWRNMGESTPTIIAKCCHGLDLLLWLTGRHCVSVSSYGNLYYFNPKHAPKGSAPYCAECRKDVRDKCLFDAYKVYEGEKMKAAVVGGTSPLLEQDIPALINNHVGPMSRCVFHLDNDAVDHQSVNLLFGDGSTAHLTMCAFTERCYRYVKVFGTEGVIEGDMDTNLLTFTRFGEEPVTIDVSKEGGYNKNGVALDDGHGGGDYYLYRDFVDYITADSPSKTRTSIDDSIESHIVGFAAEKSRLEGGKPVVLRRE
jgi:predicted dehydrogenase